MTEEQIIAYVDGELGPIEALRFEREIERDRELATRVERHRSLRETVVGHFAPIADAPVPDRLAALLDRGETVVAFRKPRADRRWFGQGGRYAALAATLVAGLVAGQLLPRAKPIDQSHGAVMAQGDLAVALDTQLASTQQGGSYRIGVSFRAANDRYCRTFAGPRGAGIGCRDDDGWALERFIAGVPAGSKTSYVQASSPLSEIAAAAQDMMAGDPLDDAQERQARDRGWTARP